MGSGTPESWEEEGKENLLAGDSGGTEKASSHSPFSPSSRTLPGHCHSARAQPGEDVKMTVRLVKATPGVSDGLPSP